ncbi:MAG: hypothetical protein MK179_03110 [Pirellulaceae bacterium]|nr:hypothetical protein [Pirellulaceae bacterium]
MIRRRIVLVGASNLARNIATVIKTACGNWGTPAQVMMAAGHGRSYGQASHVLGRTLPGIVECALWPTLLDEPPIPTAALVTDIGNDILYGVAAKTIASWVETCLQQLRQVHACIVMTELPLENLRKLESWRFRLFRTVLFPQSKLTLAHVLDEACALNERIINLANQYQATILRPHPGWYGFDPIHFRVKHQADAWCEYMSPWNPERQLLRSQGTILNGIYLRTRRPHWRRIAGFTLRCQQPCGRLMNDSTVSLF